MGCRAYQTVTDDCIVGRQIGETGRKIDNKEFAVKESSKARFYKVDR